MFIIWGWTQRPESVGQGNFYCPGCQKETWYDHRQMRTWGTLFFIPLIPMATGQRFVQCRQCQGTFVEAILNMPALVGISSEDSSGVQPGERILGKREQYWYPGTVRGKAGKKIKVHFDDATQMVLSKSKVIPLDLRVGDPVYVRCPGGPDFLSGTIIAISEHDLEARLDNGRQQLAKLADVRVIWEDDDAEGEDS